MSAKDGQVGGDHYQKLGDYQPMAVLKKWLTPEEFRGYIKGTAIAYLAREADKGGDEDVRKAGHTLEFLIEELAREEPVTAESQEAQNEVSGAPECFRKFDHIRSTDRECRYCVLFANCIAK